MELRQLSTFASIAKEGSFTKAAEKTGYAQSSVTTQIQLLEQELGIKLFERIGKNIALTSDGTRFLTYAQKILKLSEEAKNAMSNSDIPKGTLTVGAPESLCVTRLQRILKEFHTQYPEVDLTVRLDTCEAFKRMLRENAIDIAIFIDNGRQENEFTTALQFPEPMALLAVPEHPLHSGKPVGPEEIEGQSVILTENGCAYRAAFSKILADAGVKPRSVLESGSIQAIKQLTVGGLGISFLPLVAAEEEIRRGSLVCLDWKGPDFGMVTHVIYHKDKWVSPAMRIFLEMLKTIQP